jgi:hypothetical protein
MFNLWSLLFPTLWVEVFLQHKPVYSEKQCITGSKCRFFFHYAHALAPSGKNNMVENRSVTALYKNKTIIPRSEL